MTVHLLATTSAAAPTTNITNTKRISTSSSSRPQWREAVAGACAGAFAKTAVAPIERVKLLQQLRGSLVVMDDASQMSSSYKNPNAFQVARAVYRQEGLLGFWRGNLANVLQQGGTAGLNFMLMDWYKQIAVNSGVVVVRRCTTTTNNGAMHQEDSHHCSNNNYRTLLLWTSFLSGGLAGGTATTVLYPIQFLRTRLAMDVEARHSMRSVLQQTLQSSDGVRGLFQGYGISVAGVFVYRALHLGGYDALKTEVLLQRRRRNRRGGPSEDAAAALTWTERMVAAQAVSLMAGTLCYPIDSVRRRLMMQAGVPAQERLYRNTLDCVRHIVRTEGLRGFYLGLGPNLVRSLGAALLLVAYDAIKGML